VKSVVVVGSGAGGAAVARELSGSFDVTILEEGGSFRPLRLGMPVMERLKATGLLLDERMTSFLFPPMRIRRSVSGGAREAGSANGATGMAIVNGRCVGGTTTISAGNALRVDRDLREIGVDLDREFEQLSREVPASTDHQQKWRPDTRELFGVCRSMGLTARPLPKMIDFRKCRRCGRCILGCPTGAKWDARSFVDQALGRGARLLTGHCAQGISMDGKRAAGVWTTGRAGRKFLPADIVVLAAGGLGSPVILQRSGIPCEERLFVDPVLCLAGRREGTGPTGEISMPFAVQQDSYILSPYFDYLSFLYNRSWRLPGSSVLSLMVKLADSGEGSCGPRGIRKALTMRDQKRLSAAVKVCRRILLGAGVREDSLVLGTVNAGHPGGMIPLTPADARSLHPSRLCENLYVADASLLPRALGNPPILTVMALATAVARKIKEKAL
jgi:choline dehydrogenase-like flavoprotein